MRATTRKDARRGWSWSWTIMCASVLVVSPTVASAMVVTGFYREENTTNNPLQSYGRDFSLPANGSIIGWSAHRYDPVTKKYLDESASWSGTITQNPAGTWHVEITNDTAPPVGKGVKMKFDVKYDVPDQGGIGHLRGIKRKYGENPDPKKDQGKGEHKGGGIPALPAAGVDGAVHRGGPSGSNLIGLGINIPPNQYAYLYQVNVRAGSPNVTSLRLPSVANRFTSLFQKSFSHNGAIDSTYFEISDTVTTGPGVFDPTASVAVFETAGGPGVSATSWGAEGADVYARFSGLSAGQSSNILVGISPYPPDPNGTVDNEVLGTASSSDGNRTFIPSPAPPPVPDLPAWGKTFIVVLLLLLGWLALRPRSSSLTR